MLWPKTHILKRTKMAHVLMSHPVSKWVIWILYSGILFDHLSRRLKGEGSGKGKAPSLFLPLSTHPFIPGSHSLASQEFECNVPRQGDGGELIQYPVMPQLPLHPLLLSVHSSVLVMKLDLFVSFISALPLYECLRLTDHTAASEARKQKQGGQWCIWWALWRLHLTACSREWHSKWNLRKRERERVKVRQNRERERE